MTVRQTLGLLALCLLSSVIWLMADLLPTTMAPVAGEGFRLLLVGAVGLVLYFSTRRTGGFPSITCSSLVVAASLGLIGLPFLLLAAAEGKIAATSGVLVFAGMPVVLAVAGAPSSADSGLRLLPYGLLGVAGLLVLLPLQVPRGEAGILGLGMLVLAMISVAVSMMWLHRLLDGFPILVAVGLAGLVNGIALMFSAGIFNKVQWDWHGIGVESLRCLLFNLPETMLLIWLTKEITPQRLSVRYLIAPLLTVVEGLVLLRPRFEGRTLFGLILLGFGGYLMLRSEGSDQDTSLKLG